MLNELDLSRPFTTRQFREAGGDPGVLRSRQFKSLTRSVWVRSDAVDSDCMFRAALALHVPTAYLSRVSAAAVLGLPVPDHVFVHVTVDREEDRRFRPQIKPHVSKRPRRIVTVRGMRVTSPIDSFIDCAGMLSFIDLVIMGDAVCRSFKIRADDLRRACHESGAYYAGLARVAAAYVRDGVDSPMETRLRMLIVLSGLPEPEVNVILRWEDGAWKRRFDLCYRRIKLIIDYDGRQHADDTGQWRGDIERREELDEGGYRMLIVTSHGIFVDPGRTLHRVRRQLVLLGWGDVPPLKDDWKLHFAA